MPPKSHSARDNDIRIYITVFDICSVHERERESCDIVPQSFEILYRISDTINSSKMFTFQKLKRTLKLYIHKNI